MLELLVAWTFLGTTLLSMFGITAIIGTTPIPGGSADTCWICEPEATEAVPDSHTVCLQCRKDLFPEY
jgi:hypothetical protein